MVLILIGLIFLSAGCVTTGTKDYPLHPTLQKSQLPELISLRDFFINTDFENEHEISPDGKKLAWIASRNKRRMIHFKTIGEDNVKYITTKKFKSINSFKWAPDSRHMYFHGHKYGDENLRIYMVDIEAPLSDEKELIMFEQDEVKCKVYFVPRFDKKHIFVIHNERNSDFYDLYRTNLESFKTELVDKNTGDTLSWIIDDEGQLRARIRSNQASKQERMEILHVDSGAWKEIISWHQEETVEAVGFTNDNTGMWLRSNRGKDIVGLSCLNLETGEETLVFEPKKSDLEVAVISLVNKKPMIGFSYPDYQEIHFFDDGLKADFNCFKNEEKYAISILSRDIKEEKFTLIVYRDWGAEYYLYDRIKKEKTLLSQDPYFKIKNQFARMEPIS